MKGRTIIVFFLLLGTVLGVFGPIASSDGDTEISVWIMVDFGNGEVEWAEVGLNDNHTGIKATEDACQKLGLSITVSWGQWGAYVSEIGGAAAPLTIVGGGESLSGTTARIVGNLLPMGQVSLSLRMEISWDGPRLGIF